MSWWESAYRSGRVPWDPGEYDRHLDWFLRRYRVEPCCVLEPGCGNGKSAVYLAQRGFEVLGVDLSASAVAQARRLADARGVAGRARFREGRFPEALPEELQVGADSFDLITERAFLQHLGHGAALTDSVRILRGLCRERALLYSVMIAREGGGGHWGITRWSEQEIRDALQPAFEILEMRLDVFTPGERGSVPAWISVARVL